ncbi:Hypothetical predicted protein [Mytilus galloprovincialis]|uniref:THAP-type domain-containing protein n=1 Tax=Mytilus galloprovincialis TaxID=29158 RepID=A0A8B6D8A2_MYTGA|nr:Hypothetical predicted protein [Mytilus galloprovincialis]
MDDLVKKGATKHCCYGTCNSDSRYTHKDYMEGVEFIRFPKPWRDREKCTRWINACRREGFTTERVKKDTYICSKHFVGEKGPTDADPDPIPATTTPSDSEIELLQCTLKEQEGCAKTSENETVVKYINMYLDVNTVKDDLTKFKFYTGLTVPQFMCLWGYLGPSVNKLVYWNKDCGVPDRSHKKRPGPKQKMTPMNELFMTLIRIRQGLLLEDLSYRFGVSKTTVSRVVLTWIQFLYIRLSAFRTKMFPDRSKIRKHLPKSFKKYKNIRCIIDCTEVFVQQPRNFGKQGNCYSSYKGHTTYKFLVGIAPNGTIVYISDAFEGSISDKEIVKKSGFLDTLNNGDEIMADRGFTIDDLLMSRGAKLIIPPFLGSRDKFTPQEEASTKDIAKHRIHVERAIERMKKIQNPAKNCTIIPSASVFTDDFCNCLSC